MLSASCLIVLEPVIIAFPGGKTFPGLLLKQYPRFSDFVPPLLPFKPAFFGPE
jgi:hypothetical protein